MGCFFGTIWIIKISKMESKNAEDLKNLLLKIVLPLAFPVAGSFISDLITKRRGNRLSYTYTSDCSVQFDHPSYGSTCKEEEEQEMESTRRASRKLVRSENAGSTAGRLMISGVSRQASNAEELMETAASENAAEIVVDDVQHDDLAMADELAILKSLVSGLEERASSIECQFHDYCDMKEQESSYQKMQIMCLGMKLELLESQNQQLEAAAVEVRAAAEEFAAMRGRFDMLQSKLKKMTKRRKQDSDAVDKKIMALVTKQAQMARRCEEFKQCMEEMKQLTLQLQEQKGANNENVEVAVERSLRKLSSGRELVDGLEALRDRWASDMEEMIYLGWITAWLQHDLLLSDDHGDGEFGTVVVDDGGDPPREEECNKGETVVAAIAPSKEVRLCKAASSSSSSSSTTSGPPQRLSVDGQPPSCLAGFAGASGAGGRDGGGWGIGRPRLLRKLRGWAGGRGRCKRPCRIVGPCCQNKE